MEKEMKYWIYRCTKLLYMYKMIRKQILSQNSCKVFNKIFKGNALYFTLNDAGF